MRPSRPRRTAVVAGALLVLALTLSGCTSHKGTAVAASSPAVPSASSAPTSANSVCTWSSERAALAGVMRNARCTRPRNTGMTSGSSQRSSRGTPRDTMGRSNAG